MTSLTSKEQLANLVKLQQFAHTIAPDKFHGQNVQLDYTDADISGCFIHCAYHNGKVLPNALQQAIFRIVQSSMFGRWHEVKSLLPIYFGPGSDEMFNTTPRDLPDAINQLDSFIKEFQSEDETEQDDTNHPEIPAPKVTRHINAKGESFDIIAHFDGTFSVYKLTAVIENRDLQEMLIAVQ